MTKHTAYSSTIARLVSRPAAPSLPVRCPTRTARLLLTAAAAALVSAIALLDVWAGRDLALGLLYLVPVVAAAWWAGASHGLLVALAAAASWHAVDTLESPDLAAALAWGNNILRFAILVLAALLVARLHRGIRREQQLARTDPLTGAANGRTFYQAAAAEVERARRNGRPLTLAYLDLDNFKQLNDRLGHAAGDAALLHLVESIQLRLRTADLLARLGGDEFALLLPDTGARGAAGLLERLQRLLAEEMTLKGWPVTVSIGAITFLDPHWDVDVMIHEVDALMFDAKRKGKGRVEHMVVSQSTTPRGRQDKRATARVLCNLQARVRPQGDDDTGEEFALVSDLSDTGVGILLDCRVPNDSVLIIEALAPGMQAILARVVHASPTKRGWLHGCELSTRLDAAELQAWLGETPSECDFAMS